MPLHTLAQLENQIFLVIAPGVTAKRKSLVVMSSLPSAVAGQVARRSRFVVGGTLMAALALGKADER
jgi:hypothetical protein